MRHFCLAFVCVGLIYFTASCNKENIPAGDMPLVRRINGAIGDSTGSWEFFYDSTQRLQSIRLENNNGYKSTISIASPVNDTAIVTTLYRQPNGVDILSADTLLYKDGRIVKKLSYSSTNVYVYDAPGRLITDSAGSRASRNNRVKAQDFFYDAHDNMVSAHTYYDSAGTTATGETMNITCSSNENPYYKIGPLFYICCNSTFSLSKNTRTAVRYESYSQPPRTEEYSYGYNSGFLTRMTIRNSGSRILTYDFYY